MDIFGNIEKMSDDQLHEYVNRLSVKLSIVGRLASSSGASDQLRNLLEIARAQLTDRVLATSFKQMINTRPPEIVTDPEMAAKNLPEAKPSAHKVQPINRVQVKRSSKPTSAIDLSPSPTDNQENPK